MNRKITGIRVVFSRLRFDPDADFTYPLLASRIVEVMVRPIFVCVLAAAVSSSAHAQWPKVSLGSGGETNIAADGKGNVYATCHLPAKLMISRDWGQTFTLKQTYGDACCDLIVLARPSGKVNVVYLLSGVNGITSWYSSDFGNTFQKSNTLNGPLDREWVGIDPRNGTMYMDYSIGYIGGPRSSGIYLAKSTDDGKTWTQTVRIDNEGPNDEPVDPYMATGTTGRIYAMWTTSSDRNTIDRFRLAVSNDGGQTFTGHKTLGTLHKSLGDTQERWMLGSIVAVGPDTVYAFYPDYAEVQVNNITYKPMLLHYTYSTDGGQSFSAPQTVLSLTEIQNSIANYESHKLGNVNFPYYIQTLNWACADAYGRVHVAWQDNRSGQGMVSGSPYNKWHIRTSYTPTGQRTFKASELVSTDVIMKRPPLDFIGITADQEYVYIDWVETPNSTGDWNFSGNMYVARRKFTKSERIMSAPPKAKVDGVPVRLRDLAFTGGF